MGSAEVGEGIPGRTAPRPSAINVATTIKFGRWYDYLEEEKMRTNQVKEKLKRGEPVLGAWLSLPSVPSARIMARLGFDWLVVDMEHSAQNAVLMADMVATIADAETSAPIVRIPGNSVEWFKWALDAGAWGVVVPMVNTREEAQRVVAYAKYPPLGTRSIGGAFGPYVLSITCKPV